VEYGPGEFDLWRNFGHILLALSRPSAIGMRKSDGRSPSGRNSKEENQE
jgi:hypothetical protein